MPKAKPPIALPTTRPITGAHSRHAPRKRSPAAIMMARVTPAVTGAAAGDAPSGTSVSLPRKVVATGHRNQHQHGAGHGRSEHLPEQRQLGGQGELEQAGHEDQGGEQSLPAPFEGGYADGEERGGAAHEEDIARPDASDADGLDDGGDAADHEGGADRP